MDSRGWTAARADTVAACASSTAARALASEGWWRNASSTMSFNAGTPKSAHQRGCSIVWTSAWRGHRCGSAPV